MRVSGLCLVHRNLIAMRQVAHIRPATNERVPQVPREAPGAPILLRKIWMWAACRELPKEGFSGKTLHSSAQGGSRA